MNERCMCGDPECPSCGTAMGTYVDPNVQDEDDSYERMRQQEVDDERE